MAYNKRVSCLAQIIASACSVRDEWLRSMSIYCYTLAYDKGIPDIPDKWDSNKLREIFQAVDKAYDFNSYDAAQAADPERDPEDVPPPSDEIDRRSIRASIIRATPAQVRQIANYTSEVTAGKAPAGLTVDEKEALSLFRSMTPDQRTQVLSWVKERHAD